MKLNCTLAACLLVASFLAVPAQPVRAQKQAKLAPYVHTVIFYVKKDVNKGAVDEIIDDVHKLLGDIPSIRGLQVGKPAAKATPEVAVTDYQIGLLCLFDDAAGLKEYLDHPKHLDFVKKHKDKFEKVLVYDFQK